MQGEFDREVRFAVVIYGGVSLAVYINGVVQELLRLVRSTATLEPGAKLRGSETVYRKLACLMALPAVDPVAGTLSDEDREDQIELRGTVENGVVHTTEAPQTRFVVDVLSGTSAGGINAVYLAKALSNNQSLGALARMWVTVADIEKLLNDSGSVEHPVRRQSPPKSLLNSRWMYLKLLEALDAMDERAPGGSLVGDLDLFSTATDVDGVALPIALADKQVFELRHRNVFHFRRRGEVSTDAAHFAERNDFVPQNNPFLAFASRCTSAFPFAFEPMALCDIFDIIRYLPAHAGKPYCDENTDQWNDFFLDYLRDFDRRKSTAFSNRSFGDGGYLDNKPFSYAVDTIMRRHADLPVDRKLIYIEPSPEDVKKVEKLRIIAGDRPNAIENSLAALVDLPRYETIREDLERILEWNRNVRRVKRVLRDATPGVSPADIAEYRNGPAYRFYLRLRLSSVTDLVATQVAEALNLDPKCAQGDAIRALAGGWRTARMAENLNAQFNEQFLDVYDREYLQRAIQFLRRQVRSLRKNDERRQRFINDISEAQSVLHRIAEQRLPDLTRDPATPAVPEPASQRDTRRRDLEFIVDPQFAAELRESQPALQIPVSALDAGDAGREVRIKYLLDAYWLKLIDEADKRLREHFKGLQTVRRKLNGVMVGLLGDWTRFEVQDSVVFPVLFGTNVGEVDAIDVIRISPADVAPLTGVDDDLDPREPKLMGQKFGAFGGFLDRRWRLHDMLRGRLQAAERLITALLPNADDRTRTFRDALIAEAQEEIAKEWDEDFSHYLDEMDGLEAAPGAKKAADHAR